MKMASVRRSILMMVALFAASRASAQAAPRTRTVRIAGKTIVAFFPVVTQKQVDGDDELTEVLDDFQYHTAGARRALRPRGVRVVEIYADTIRITVSGRTRVFVPPRDSTVGYYVVAPSRRRVVWYGVMTDSDLTTQALAFFK